MSSGARCLWRHRYHYRRQESTRRNSGGHGEAWNRNSGRSPGRRWVRFGDCHSFDPRLPGNPSGVVFRNHPWRTDDVRDVRLRQRRPGTRHIRRLYGGRRRQRDCLPCRRHRLCAGRALEGRNEGDGAGIQTTGLLQEYLQNARKESWLDELTAARTR